MLKFLPQGGVCTPQGFKASGVAAGIKESGLSDVALLYSTVPAQCFGTFTTNKVQAAPVLFDKKVLESNSRVAGIIVNSGNANACTGHTGYQNTVDMAVQVQELLGLASNQVLVCSTGVIGQLLPMGKVRKGIDLAVTALKDDASTEFSQAIMTTDTVHKTLGAELQTESGVVKIGGACKGSGMIHPNMATMLAFITTDIELPVNFAGEFKAWVNQSFNAITVDGDTSTNDSCILLANGASGIKYEDLSLSEQGQYRRAMEDLMRELAHIIVRDGEGSTKLVEVKVEKAPNNAEALQMARFISTSNLVKTAMFGQDPNWGRILSSAGSSGASLNPDLVDLYFDDVLVLEQGQPTQADFNALSAVVKKEEYQIRLVLNLGNATASAFTCDLSYDYVKINAEYTT